jgi:hypothetical protein
MKLYVAENHRQRRRYGMDNLATVPRALVRRSQKCLQANSGHFEHLLQFNTRRSHPVLCASNLSY